MTLLIELDNPENYADVPSSAQVAQWAQAAWQGQDSAGVMVRVVSEGESQSLNHEFRAKDTPTNVLSFPYEPSSVPLDEDEVAYLGDLVICQVLVKQEATEQGKTLAQHWAHLLVHGLLHLQGYDHEQDAAAEAMERLEIAILAQLGFPNPYK